MSTSSPSAVSHRFASSSPDKPSRKGCRGGEPPPIGAASATGAVGGAGASDGGPTGGRSPAGASGGTTNVPRTTSGRRSSCAAASRSSSCEILEASRRCRRRSQPKTPPQRHLQPSIFEQHRREEPRYQPHPNEQNRHPRLLRRPNSTKDAPSPAFPPPFPSSYRLLPPLSTTSVPPNPSATAPTASSHST